MKIPLQSETFYSIFAQAERLSFTVHTLHYKEVFHMNYWKRKSAHCEADFRRRGLQAGFVTSQNANPNPTVKCRIHHPIPFCPQVTNRV